MKTLEKEIDNAKLHIAHQIAIRDKCIVDTGVLHIFGGKDDFYLSDYGFDYDDAPIDEIIENIEVVAIYIFQEQEIVVLLGKDIRKPAEKNRFLFKTITERPEWIHNLQIVRDILGTECFVGIGITGNYSQFYKGIYAADLAAAQTIASEKRINIEMYTMDVVENKSAHHASGILSMSEGVELYGFYILARWIEPDGSLYYSLGVAHKL
ncbi:MAG: hypothetical protein LBH43_20270 [Treponema sp.]|jgi:hypothetical protein|nr:hypothetical protein [Treponema sp.]